MHRLRTILAASALLSTGFAQGKDASATLPELCAKYRNQLLAWSTQCEAERLFTMADRLNRVVEVIDVEERLPESARHTGRHRVV